MRGPVGLGQLCFFRRRYHADNRGTEMLRPLAHNQAHAAGGGVHQDRLAWLHAMRAAQQVLRGHALQHHRGTGGEADRIGQCHQAVGGDGALGGIAADRACIGHAVAGFHVGDARANRDHGAGAFHADGQRHVRGLVEAGAEIDVDIVQADGLVLDQRLSGTGLGGGHILPLHHFRAAVLMDADGFGHLGSPFGA